ncbi:MAG: lytic murein transglycosylase, partial [Methyloligellaceae bacterium]
MRTAVIAVILSITLASSALAGRFSSCVSGLKKSVVRAGVSRSLANRALKIRKPDAKVLRLSKSQPEFRLKIWDYFSFLVDE